MENAQAKGVYISCSTRSLNPKAGLNPSDQWELHNITSLQT